MSKLILVFVTAFSAASISAACPFTNMSANSRTGINDQSTNFYNVALQNHGQTQDFQQPVKRQK